MKLKIDYSKCYPSKINEVKINGLYEILLEHRGLFIDYFYKNVDSKTLSHIYFKMEDVKIDNSTKRKNAFIFIVKAVLNLDKYVFLVYSDSNTQICSDVFLPLLDIIKSFVREYKITNLLN